MKKIIGVRFKRLGKIYFFDPKWLEVKKGENVIVETSQGEEIAEVVVPNRLVEEEKITTPLKKVLRLASQRDLKHAEECRKKEKEAFEVCKKKIKEHGLEMTLTDVEYKFDNSKILFYFTADGRIDFRELVKDLAAIYKTRIELRQIGVRDEVKRIGGNGVCGRELCCCSFLRDFETVSIKMAKEQNISLNPSKISGNCGRLMCCLKYEQDVYEDKLSHLPKIGAIVQTDDGEGVVDSIETLKEIVKVKLKDDNDETYFKKYNAKDLKILQNIESEVVDEEEKENMEELQNSETTSENNQNVSNDTKLDPNIKDNKDSTSNNTNINNFSTNQKPNNSFDFSNIDMNTIMKMKSVMDKMNNSNNPSSNLLHSLKPYLRESRREKVDQYANLLNIAQITGLFNNDNNSHNQNNRNSENISDININNSDNLNNKESPK